MRKDVAVATASFAASVFALVAFGASGGSRKKRPPSPPPEPKGQVPRKPTRQAPRKPKGQVPRKPKRQVPRKTKRRAVPKTAGVYSDHRELYARAAGAPYGPYHGADRPPGLPLVVATAANGSQRVIVDGLDEQTARDVAERAFRKRFKAAPAAVRVRRVRLASARGAALKPIAEQAAEHGHGQVFVDTITHLAQTEGEGGTFAVAARNFSAACTSSALNRRRLCTLADAPRAQRSLITAWGVFQWNRDAGRELHTLDGLGLRAPAIPSDWMPWDWTAAEEIAIPINYYAQLWALVRRRGGSELDAARGMRLWHTGPTRFRRYLARGANREAWAAVQDKVSATIDRHLKKAGVA